MSYPPPDVVEVERDPAAVVEIEAPAPPQVVEVVEPGGPPGPQGPQGPPGVWVQLTQAEFDALSPPDPHTLYVIVG